MRVVRTLDTAIHLCMSAPFSFQSVVVFVGVIVCEISTGVFVELKKNEALVSTSTGLVIVYSTVWVIAIIAVVWAGHFLRVNLTMPTLPRPLQASLWRSWTSLVAHKPLCPPR